MIFNCNNARWTDVVDVEARETLKHVICVDTDAGEVHVAVQPLQISSDGESVATRAIKFRSIYPIYGLRKYMPEMLHCYGRRAA